MTNTSLNVGTRLSARSRPIADPGDLLDHFGPGGFAWLDGDTGFVTSGVATFATPETAPAVLEGCAHEVEGGTPEGAGPRAVGALPFNGVGRMVVPAQIVARDADGRAWCTTLGPQTPARTAGAPSRRPTRFDVHAASDFGAWEQAVRAVLEAIARRELDKVVLARAVDVRTDAPFDRREILAYLRATQPGCRIYADSGFVGASPELLVRRRGTEVVARPLAGTGTDIATLATSVKDAWEHELVVESVAAHLRELCDDVVVSDTAPMRFADLVHLATTITARTRAASALDLARALHPTPAVAGSPPAEALRLIARLEGFDRDRYAGPCGWVDVRGDGEFVVALRCADIDGADARLYVGAGIVEGSDPHAEWAETQVKFDPMLRALVRP